MVRFIKGITNAFKNGLKARRALNPAMSTVNNARAAKAMRTFIFGGIGATAVGATLVSCDDDHGLFSDDFQHKHTMTDSAEVNLKYVDIPTKIEYITKTDTIKEPEYIHTTDTIRVPEYIHNTDTIWVDKIINRTDTIYRDKIVHDTIRVEVPGETIVLPDTLRPEPDPIIDDFTHNVLGQNNDTTGVTVALQGNKQYEQIFGRGTLVPSETTNKKMVYKTFNSYYEDDHNPLNYFTKTEITVGKLPDGRKGLYISAIPAYAGTNYKTYFGQEQDWNRAGAKNELIVKSKDGKYLERYVRGLDGQFIFAGTISAKEQKVLQDKHILPEGNQTWEQNITNFETKSALVTKEPGKEWKY